VPPWVATMTQLMKRHLSRWYVYPAYWTAIDDGSDIERWNPRLHHRDHVALMDQYQQIPDPNLRRLYQVGTRFGWLRRYLRVFRAEF